MEIKKKADESIQICVLNLYINYIDISISLLVKHSTNYTFLMITGQCVGQSVK